MTTSTTDKLRFRPCTHLTHRPAVANDTDAAGEKLPKGHVVIVRVADCHEEPEGVIDPQGVAGIPLTYLSPTEARGSLTGSTECLFRIANERVYRASLGGTNAPAMTEPVRPDYESMTGAELLVTYNGLAEKPLKKWGGKKADLITRLTSMQA